MDDGESIGQSLEQGGICAALGGGFGALPAAWTLGNAGAAVVGDYAGTFWEGFSNAQIQFSLGSGVGGEFFQRLNAGIQAAAGANAEDLQSGFQNIVSEQFPNGENQLAAGKGFSGIGSTAEGVSDFAGTPYLYPVTEGQSNIVTIKLTGSYASF